MATRSKAKAAANAKSIKRFGLSKTVEMNRKNVLTKNTYLESKAKAVQDIRIKPAPNPAYNAAMNNQLSKPPKSVSGISKALTSNAKAEVSMGMRAAGAGGGKGMGANITSGPMGKKIKKGRGTYQ